jgi:hypothetical protein
MTKVQKSLWASAIAGLLLLVAFTVVFHTSLRNAWAAVTPQQQSITELYFTDPKLLPMQLTDGGTYAFDVTIHNASSRPQSYTLLTYLQTAQRDRTLQAEQIQLAANERRVVHMSVTIADTHDAQDIAVTLSGQSETIHFQVKGE